MFVRALLAFLFLPGLAAIAAPPVIALFDPWRGERRDYCVVVMIAGAFVLLWCVRDFYVSGKGTLAPWDPPKRLVVVGLYRYLRNPMYVGVLLLVLGWSLFLASALVAGYFAALALVFHIRVVKYEEPWLRSSFPEAWPSYSAGVGRWLPRISPWEDGP
jgi:protein-S-isoprenylcysteine O-methyltransferase Ste14